MSQLPPLGGFFSKKAEAYILPPKKKPKKQYKKIDIEELDKEAQALFKQAALEELQRYNKLMEQLNIK